MLDGEIIKDFYNHKEDEDKEWLATAPEYCKLCQGNKSKNVNLR